MRSMYNVMQKMEKRVKIQTWTYMTTGATHAIYSPPWTLRSDLEFDGVRPICETSRKSAGDAVDPYHN